MANTNQTTIGPCSDCHLCGAIVSTQDTLGQNTRSSDTPSSSHANSPATDSHPAHGEPNICEGCLSTFMKTRMQRSTVSLIALWLPICLYIVSIVTNMQIAIEWKFANAIPIVLIGGFISAFLYDGLAQYLRAGGTSRSRELWKLKNKKFEPSRANATRTGA